MRRLRESKVQGGGRKQGRRKGWKGGDEGDERVGRRRKEIGQWRREWEKDEGCCMERMGKGYEDTEEMEGGDGRRAGDGNILLK